jgi:hypothetical protein
MKITELTKEIKGKIESYTYEGIDEAIKLAEEHGTIDFFDKFLGELQLRCERYNSDHVCSEAKFFNRGMRVKASHFTYRALLGLVNIACKGSKAYEYRNSIKKITLIGHIWTDGNTYGGNIDIKYIKNFGALTDIIIEEAGTITNLDLINGFKYLKSISICGPLRALENIPYSLRDMPLISLNLSLPKINFECYSLEHFSIQNIYELENLEFISGLKNLKTLNITSCKIISLTGIPTSIENFSFSASRFYKPIDDSEFEALRNLKQLKKVEIISTNRDFSFLINLDNLEVLRISSESEKVLMPNLSSQKKLKYISIANATQNLDFLEMNEEIEMISVCRTNVENIKGLKNCNKIKVIDLIDCKNLNSLSGLENCKEMDITIRNIGVENLDGLNGCVKLSKFGTYVIENFDLHGGFASTDVETFSDGTNDLDYVIRNNTLYISGCNNLVDISGIKNATNLMGLSITSCKNLKCIAGIETLQNLYEIDFSDCSELEDISIIKNFPNLRSLNLSGCKKLKVKPDKLILETQIEIDTFKSKL